ncbi:MAG: DUF2157 domain-containing protein [Bacillota bacterium]
MDNKKLPWLYDELPKLVDEGVISKKTAQNIKEYYGLISPEEKRKNLLLIFSILGAILIGSGIILLFAHNWAELTRLTRTLIIFSGLIGAQSLVGWVLFNKAESTSWREGSATFLTFIVGAAIALIGQTYNLPSDLNNFLLVWMLLSVPLVYLVDTTIPALLYLAGVSWWGLITDSSFSLLLWLLVGLIVPYYIKELLQNKNSRKVTVLSWGLSFSVLVVLFTTLDLYHDSSVLWHLIYLSYFVVLYLLGQKLNLKTKVFQGLGLVGTYIVIYLVGSLTNLNSFEPADLLTGNFIVYLIAVVLLGVNGYLLWQSWEQQDKNKIVLGIAPVVLLIGVLLSKVYFITLLLYNAYLLLIGLGVLFKGLEKEMMKLANAGIVMIALQILGRFFLLDISFVWRGIVFVLVGIGFLVSNILINRQLKE